MDIESVRKSYARWAPVYDRTFGAITDAGRRQAVDLVNSRGGRVLEVGVGTGMSLPRYRRELEITGVDASGEMLDKARAKAEALRLGNVAALRQMDARRLDFPDASFDVVVAMHVLSVVPEPERVMAEIARVCRPGGGVVVTNHFSRTSGPLAVLERRAAPLADLIGWHSDFEMERVLGEESLKLVESRALPPLGVMTLLLFEKAAAS